MGFLDRMKQNPVKITSRPEKIEADEISLKGTGLTKRVAERDAKAYEAEVKKALQSADEPTLIKTQAEKDFQHAIDQTIASMELDWAKMGIVLDDSQKLAISGIMHNQFSVLIGAAGTGKTTITRMVIEQLSKVLDIVDARDTYFETVTDGLGNSTRILASRNSATKPEMVPSIAGAAYTGRASQQFKRALPAEMQRAVSTMHMMLGFTPEYEDYEAIDAMSGLDCTKTRMVFRPSFNEMNKLPFTLFIFDEASMIPIPLWNDFIAATNPNVRILLIGDINQLPPVYGKSILGYAMRKWPVFELKTVHRQVGDNGIIKNAHNILNGRMIENVNTADGGVHLIGNSGKSLAPPEASGMRQYALQVIKQLHGLNRYNPYRDTVIVPQNKGFIGQVELNAMLVTMFNPQREEHGIIINKRINIHTGTEHRFFAIGDKVMITSNINDTDPPITNGMIGIVDTINANGRYDKKRSQVDYDNDRIDMNEDPLELDIDADAFSLVMSGDDEPENEKKSEKDGEDQRQASHVMTIKFETGQSFSASTAGDYRKVQHGYAMTCHKAQGGEYPNIIIILHSANNVMLTREWFYTALTRARNNVYIICNNRGLKQALMRQHIKGATLQEKIKSYILWTETDDNMDEFDRNKHPVLWDNKFIP